MTVDNGDRIKRPTLEVDACLNVMKTRALQSKARMRFNGKAKNDRANQNIICKNTNIIMKSECFDIF